MKYSFLEDFSDFDIVEFPYDKAHSALGEYHHIMPEGYTGNFYDPICNHQWRSQDGSWLITNDNGKNYLEQNRGDYSHDHFSYVSSILIHKAKLYTPYYLSFDIKGISTKAKQGVVFNYIHNLLYDALVLDRNELLLIHRDEMDVTVYERIDFHMDTDLTYLFKILVSDDLLVYLNDELILKSKIKFKEASHVGFISKCATRYGFLKVDLLDEEKENEKHLKETTRILNKRKEYPEIECIKKIDLKDFGSGRQLRFVNQNGKQIFVLAQHQKRIMRDSYARLSSITAFDIDGNILWSHGKRNNDFDHSFISCDLPFQIADINNDGQYEVIYAKDFYVYIVDLLTGKILKKNETPKVLDDPLFKDYPFDRLNPDGLRVANFSNLGYQGDYILKDRYRNVFAINAKTNKILFRYHHKNTGHFPYIADMDNDGLDELLIGYDFVDHDGTIKWSLPMETDHTDEIIYIDPYLKGENKFYLASGNEGFNIVSKNGEIIKSVPVGHAQRISVAKYDNHRSDLLVAVTSFWGADRIIYLFDGLGNKLKEIEMEENGNMASPMNYDGIHTLILSNVGNKGGLLDSDLDRVVILPEDGHPTACAEVIDIDSDGVDELICWDNHEMWIYKAKTFKKGGKYLRYPDNAYSNYRGEYLVKIDE